MRPPATSACMVVFALSCGGNGGGSGSATDPGTSTTSTTGTSGDATGSGSGSTDGSTGGTGDPPAEDPFGGGETLTRFALLGDYGTNTVEEGLVAMLVKSVDPAFIVTLGDNNYVDGEASTIDANVGQYFHEYIDPYLGSYGEGSPSGNRFWPSLGNHDYYTPNAQPYLDYFTLPNNERYYDVDLGPVHLFVINSNEEEPDGRLAGSAQAAWFEGRIQASTAPFQLAIMHHPPASSGQHGTYEEMQWPFRDLGIDAVLAGHEHSYERITWDRLPVLISGNGSRVLYDMGEPVVGSQVRYNLEFGALLAEVTNSYARFTSADIGNGVIDQVIIRTTPDPTPPPDVLFAADSIWRYWDQGSEPAADWMSTGYDDTAWQSGAAPLGYGFSAATVIDFGPDANAKYPTAYFRAALDVADPTAYDRYILAFRRDDGAAVWLNGELLMLSNLGANATYDTLALDLAEDDSWYGIQLQPAQLQAGSNTLAVEVHQATLDSSDLIFELRLLGVSVDPLVPFGGQWRWLDDAAGPGADWTLPEFDDSGWAEGAAPFGAGHGDEATALDESRHNSWFRHTLTIDDPATTGDLRLRLVREDGAIVWINGVELHRTNVRAGAEGEGTFAHYNVVGREAVEYQETLIPVTLLRAGANVIAVESHRANIGAPDRRFDMEITKLD